MQKTERRPPPRMGINALMKMQPTTLGDRITKLACHRPSSIATAAGFAQNGIFEQLKLLLLDIGTHVWPPEPLEQSRAAELLKADLLGRIVAFYKNIAHIPAPRSVVNVATYNMSQEFPADQSDAARLMRNYSIVIIQSQLRFGSQTLSSCSFVATKN